ncbi:hypothetical protein LCGC14_2355800 [marine sediment metagenome]|uniref:Uncharacterized protein n=1 Tax=marine sediment metagenome TaxID=412755 RepID=A0A0F9F2W1_9ZZZZ
MKEYQLKVFVVEDKDFGDMVSMKEISVSIASGKLQEADVLIYKEKRGYKILKDRLGIFDKGEL